MSIGIYKQTAQDIMSSHVVAIHVQERVHDALKLMTENHLSMLPVVTGDSRCVGVVSQADLMQMAGDLDDEQSDRALTSYGSPVFGAASIDEITNERIDDVMSTKVKAASPDTLVVDIADLMLEQRVHHVPVCDSDGNLMGVVSTMDILKALRTPVQA